MSERRQLGLAALFLCLLPLGVLWPCLFAGQAFVPFDSRGFPPASLQFSADQLAAMRQGSNFDISEKTLLCLHELRFAQDELRQGRFPAWNPYVRGGAPLYANALNGLANPLFLPHLLLDPERAFAWTAWLSFALAGLLMLGFLRELGLSLPAALLGAVLCAWSGTMVANAHFFMRFGALLFLPGMFWALERLRKGSGPGAAVGLAACLAFTWTAGFPPYALAATLLAGCYLLVVLVRSESRLRVLVWGSAGMALGIALAGAQLLPMFGYFPESQRDLSPDLARLPEQGFDPMGWLGFLLPGPLGRPDHNLPGDVLYETSPLCWLLFSRAGQGQAQPAFNATEYAVHLGVLPLLFLARPGLRSRRPFLAFALCAALGLLLVSTGGPVARALYALLPPVRSTPPMRFIGPVAFLLAAATALGFDAWLAPGPRGPRPVPWVAGGIVLAMCSALLLVLATCGPQARLTAFLDLLELRWGDRFRTLGRAKVETIFAPTLAPATRLLLASLVHVLAGTALTLVLLWRVPRARVAWLLPVLAAAELLWLAPPYAPCHPATGRPDSAVHEFLRAQRTARAAEGGFTVARVSAPGRDPELPSALPANSLIPERIRDLNSYAFVDGRSHRPFHALYGPELFIRDYWLKALPDDARLTLPLLDLFGVRYLLCVAPPASAPVTHAGREVLAPIAGAEGTFHVFERPDPCPRAFVVPAVTSLPDDTAIVERMAAREFTPRAAALVRADELARLPAPVPAGSGAPGTVRFVRDEPTTLELSVRGSGGGVLLLCDTFMGGWSAEVGGLPAPILRADLCFRAIPIPAGDTTVVLRYSAPLLVPGMALSVAALLVCAGLLVLAYRSSSARAHHTTRFG